MPKLILLVLFVCITFASVAQSIPLTETEFAIRVGEKQRFEVSLQKGYTLNARIEQKGIDLGIGIYKKGDTTQLAYFDSPNGDNGPEIILFEARDAGDYQLIVEPLKENKVLEGKFSIRQRFVRILMVKRDTAFASGSKVVPEKLTPQRVENLANLGKVWGFLKYYHPSVARGDYNWDAELFRILPKIISSATKPQANQELEKWIDLIGVPERCEACGTLKKDSTLHQAPDYGDLFDVKNFSASLVKKLTYIRDNRNQDDNHYVGKGGAGNPDFENEERYEKMIYPDAGYRLLAVYRYWNMIQYFFPYKYMIGEDWNKVLPEFIPKFLDAHDDTEYSLACYEIICRIHDSHGIIRTAGRELVEYFGKNAAPFQARFIEDKLVVTFHYTDTLDLRQKIKIGDVITKVDGKSVEELVKEKLPFLPGSNYSVQLRSMPYRLLRSNKDIMALEFTRNGKKGTAKVPCIKFEKIDFAIDINPAPQDSSYKLLPGNIAYVFPGRYSNRQLQAIMKLFKGTKGMIIDMRTYPSDFMPFAFGAYLKPSPSPFAKFTQGDIDYPGAFRFTPTISIGGESPEHYNGPVVAIVNSVSQSQAEYTIMAFQSAPDFTVIGSTTSGADGNASLIFLPGGRSTYISGIGVFYPDGTETQRKGIKIDHTVYPTIEGVKQGRDELLEKAIEVINLKSDGK